AEAVDSKVGDPWRRERAGMDFRNPRDEVRSCHLWLPQTGHVQVPFGSAAPGLDEARTPAAADHRRPGRRRVRRDPPEHRCCRVDRGRPSIGCALLNAAIEVEALSKRFGTVVALEDVCLKVEYGRVVGFLGPNGAGKSTLMRALLGLVRSDSG